MAETVETTLWAVEIQDSEGGPWRLMASEGAADTLVYIFRQCDEAEETAASFPLPQRARVIRFDRAADGCPQTLGAQREH